MAEGIQVTSIRRHGRDVWDVATGLLLLTLAVLIAGTFTDYGVTIDERHSTANGRYFFKPTRTTGCRGRGGRSFCHLDWSSAWYSAFESVA